MNHHPEPYRIPAQTHRIQTEVARSRFIATIAPAPTVEDAKAFLAQIRAEMPDELKPELNYSI